MSYEYTPLKRTFESATIVAEKLDVPHPWLKREAIEGRIPFLMVGKKMMMNFNQVEEILLARSKQNMIAVNPPAVAKDPI